MSLILESKKKISELSEAYVNNLCYGYSCDSNALEKIEKITNYLDVLQSNESAVSRGFTTCITPDAYECLEEQLRSLIGFPKCTDTVVDVDTSNQGDWELKNPYCISYECWNKWARITARDLDVCVVVKKQEDNLILELVLESIPCDVLLCVEVIKEANELELEVTRTKEECKLDFELLVEKVNCDLELTTYIKLIENKFTYDIIKTIYENNLSIEVDRKNDNFEIQLVSTLSKYNLKELDIDLKLIQDKFGYSPTIKKTDLLTDFNC